MKTLKNIFVVTVITLTLTACTHTDRIGHLEVDMIEGAFAPTVAGVTMRDDKGNITLQQFTIAPGVAHTLFQGAVQVGSAATFGAVAAPLYRPATSNTTNTTTNNVKNGGTKVTSAYGGSSATNINSAVATGSTANATGPGGAAASSSVTNPTVTALGGTSAANSTANPVANALGGQGGNAASLATGGQGGTSVSNPIVSPTITPTFTNGVTNAVSNTVTNSRTDDNSGGGNGKDN